MRAKDPFERNSYYVGRTGFISAPFLLTQTIKPWSWSFPFQLMRKLRVDWTKEEDSFLLLCKVAGSYLCQNMAYRMVPCTQVRITWHLGHAYASSA